MRRKGGSKTIRNSTLNLLKRCQPRLGSMQRRPATAITTSRHRLMECDCLLSVASHRDVRRQLHFARECQGCGTEGLRSARCRLPNHRRRPRHLSCSGLRAQSRRCVSRRHGCFKAGCGRKGPARVHGGRSAALRGTGQLFGSTPASDRLAAARGRNAAASLTQRGDWKSYERLRPCTIGA